MAYERLGVAFAYTAYWQALSARELGDTIFRFAGAVVDNGPARPGHTAIKLDDPGKLRPALQAYHDGRMHFSAHLSVQSPFPVARAAKQQLFRSFSTNAILAACILKSTKDMLAEVEWSGPRQVTEVVTEIAAARENAQVPIAEFRRDRAVYYKTLTTMPTSFAEYLSNLDQHNADRRRYMEASFALDQRLMETQWCDKIVETVQNIRLPDTVFLLFHVGVETSTMVLFDMNTGVAAPFTAPFGENTLRLIHQEYQDAYKNEATRESGLQKLLSTYEELFVPLITPLLRFLPGQHLKIFPRLQMNAVPFHALRLNGKYLIEHCRTLSYGQTLGLFLENHTSKPSPRDRALRVVVGEGVPVYDVIMPRVRQLYGQTLAEDRPTSWTQLIASIEAQPARDTLFACHGEYHSDNLDASKLRLTNDEKGSVEFSQVFSELDLRGCRSVIMGACESGLARADISAEYLGLPTAMLSSGAQYVIGALWTLPQLATAVLVPQYLELLHGEPIDVCDALCRVQRETMAMTKDKVASFFQQVMGSDPNLNVVLQDIEAREEHPFAHPYQWAGLQVVGDV